MVGGRSLSRLIAGSNWVLGYSHTTAAKDAFIKEHNRSRQRIADILEVFFRAGVDRSVTIRGAKVFKKPNNGLVCRQSSFRRRDFL